MEMTCPILFEQWKPITNNSVPNIIEGRYFVSNFGRAWSNFKNDYLDLVETGNGYFRVSLAYNYHKSRYHSIHRIVMIEFNPIPNYEQFEVNHLDGNKSHNWLWNLQWVTSSENIIHAYQNGLKSQYRGEDCSWATITNEQAENIAQLICTQKYTQQEISDMTGVKKHIIQNIASGSTWLDIYNKYNLSQYKKSISKMSDDDLELLCKYFQDNKNLYSVNSDLYRHALKDLFDIEYTNSMSASMSRYFNHITRKDITDKYDF